MKIGSPRIGTELEPRVLQNWMQQVITALRAIGFSRADYTTAVIDFASIAAGASATSAVTVTGARANAMVVVSTVAAPTAGIVMDGYVSADDTVTVRATNVTSGAIDPASATYSVLTHNAP